MSIEAKIAKIQTEVNKIKSGYCVLIKLINYEELQVMQQDTEIMVNALCQLVNSICLDSKLPLDNTIVEDRMILVLPDMSTALLKELISKIHTAALLYTDDAYPYGYLNCKFTSIAFSKGSLSAEEMYNLLTGTASTLQNHEYYKHYNAESYKVEEIRRRNKQLNSLRKALVNDTLTFAYQPIVDRKTNKAHYYECLLRIPDENNNPVSVGALIPDAEQKGLINVIDRRVLKMAVQELAKTPDLSLSVNISNFGVLDDDLLKLAEKLLKKHDVSTRLIIEITETALNEDYVKTKHFIDRLHKLGCRFALDDFGAGFTSLKQLMNLPIDIIKIDGSYIRDITTNSYNKYFVEALIKLSENLKIKTVAEFVENGAIAKFLIDIKIDGMQGDFFSPAVSNRDGK